MVTTRESRDGLMDQFEVQVLVEMLSIPTFQLVTRVERSRDLRAGPRPKVPRLVVKCAHGRLGLQRRVERNHIPNRTHPSVRAARASEERLPRVAEDLRRPQYLKALPFDGPPVRLPLVAEEPLPIVCNLQRD